MRRIVAALAAVVALVAAPAALADTTWTKISRDGLSGTYSPELAVDGSRIVAGWRFSDPANPSTGIDGLEVLSFVASSSADALDPQGPTNVTPGSTLTGAWNFVAPPGGGTQVVFGALFPGDINTYAHVSARNPDGTFTSPQRISDSATIWGDPSGALALSDGTLLFASSTAGGITIGRGTPTTPGIATGAPNLQNALGGCCGYEPRIGVTTGGQVWVAWYSNATSNVGLYLQQIDPATGQPIGNAARAPRSESVGNNAAPALACRDTCRVVYRIDALALNQRVNRIVSWSPGEAAPTLIATQDDTSGGLEATAAYRADGRLWVAWHQDGNQALSGSGFRATLGDGRGAGGLVQDVGAPPQTLTSYSLRGLALGNDLVLATNVALTDVNRGAAIWVNVVAPPAAAADVPVTLEVIEEGGKLKIRVQYRVKNTCATPCTARSLIRARNGKRLKAGVEPLPGDSLLFGRSKGIKLKAAGKKERFDIVVSKAALNRAKGKVVNRHKFIETRLRVWLKQPDGSELLTFRDGRIRVALTKLA
ncbi:MAG: hypothetical protein R3C15_15050 [Thermoleophilia bacterium]